MKQFVRVVACALLVVLACVAGPAQTQEPDDIPGLKHRVEELEARVSELEGEVATVSNGPLALYVDGTSGDDENDGLSWANAKQTIQAAVNAIPQVLGGDVTVYIAGGTYHELVWVGRRGRLGPFAVSFIGDEAAPESVVLDGQSVLDHAFSIDDLWVEISGMSMRRFAEAIHANESVLHLHHCWLEQNTDVAVFGANSTLQLEYLVISNNSGSGISARNSYFEDLTDCYVVGNNGDGISLSASVLEGTQLQVYDNDGIGIVSSESSHVNLYDDAGIVVVNNAGGDMVTRYQSTIRGYQNGVTGACHAQALSTCEP